MATQATTSQVQLPTFVATSTAEIAHIVEEVRAGFCSRITREVSFRKQQVRRLGEMVEENRELFFAAMHRDLHKNKLEAQITELSIAISECAVVLKNLDKWAAAERPAKDLLNFADNVLIRKEPKGTVLIMGAWNYPVFLTLAPMINAMAAGNCVILKPSEVSPYTAAVLAALIPRYLDTQRYRVINGGVAETTELLKHKFDHILYTGSSGIARIVMTAAAKHLTPVTLELGGKCPVVVSDDVDPDIVAKRISFGKYMNCGQICLSPNYILCSSEMQDKLIDSFSRAIPAFYGEDPQKSDEYARIVNSRHFERISKLLKMPGTYSHHGKDKNTYNGDIVLGGQTDMNDLYISPTVIKNVGWDSEIMTDEIFGPLMLIVPIDNVMEHAAELISSRDHPLALYVFSRRSFFSEYIIDHTQSGGVCVNDTILHIKSAGVPFGGVGESGMGMYQGKWGFDTFSHMRTTVSRSAGLEIINQLRYPPYTERFMNLLDWLLFKKM